jgi:truncated hemoglobin YjbI
MIDDLYDLIGGKQTVGAATEAFYRRVYADDTLSPFLKLPTLRNYALGKA